MKSVWLLLLIAVGSLTGCSSSPTVKVTGTVKFEDGSPLKGDLITVLFYPNEPSQSLTSGTITGSNYIEDDGSFVLVCKPYGEALWPGEYTAVVLATVPGNPNLSLVASEYLSAKTSPLKVQVVAGQMNHFDLLVKKNRKVK